MVNVDIDPLSQDPWQHEAQISVLPSLTIMSLQISPARAERTRAMVADGNDALVFSIVRMGTLVSLRNGKDDICLNAGDAMLRSFSGALVSINPQFLDTLLLCFPRAALAPAVRELDESTVRLMPAGTAAVHLLSTYATALQGSIGNLPADVQASSLLHLQDLATLALGATRDAAEVAKGRGLRAARLQAIKADIIANASQHLKLDTIAARHGISPRYVRMLFDGEHTTFTDFVLTQRLMHTHRMLHMAVFDHHTISAIAYHCGFGDLSHFNHCFRRHYQATPSDVRGRAQEARRSEMH